MEGRKFELTKEGLSEIVRPSDITSFWKIYKEQCGVDDVTEKWASKKKNVFPTIVFRGDSARQMGMTVAEFEEMRG